MGFFLLILLISMVCNVGMACAVVLVYMAFAMVGIFVDVLLIK
jgi:hypothetical protein